MKECKRALISVYDKTGLEPFARGLRELGIELLSTGGTARFLRERGIEVQELHELTGFPELLAGRVKTLHPAVFAGILARRGDRRDLEELEAHGLKPIDLVVVNLYPFQSAVAKPDVTLEEALGSLDVGGHALLRAAAKNFRDVVVVVDPSRYERVLEELRGGGVSERTKLELAAEALAYAAAHDQAVQAYFEGLRSRAGGSPFPRVLYLVYHKLRELRYGENPHLRAALYSSPQPGLAGAKQLGGEALSFNNLADLDAGWSLVQEFEGPAAVIIKHQSPCGAACARGLLEAFEGAHACDPTSAYGGVVAVNRTLDLATAERISSGFVEALIAPGYEDEALEILKRKRRPRILELREGAGQDWGLRQISGGMLVQERDRARLERGALQTITKRKPSEQELEDLMFAWRVVKHVRSNAVVLAKQQRTVGIGGGQPSRVDAVELAIKKAGERARGAVLASDGFFPFPDSVELAAEAGVKALIQPGGSIRDEQVIRVADERGLAMVFTGVRCFKH